jgi:hypothetical protein
VRAACASLWRPRRGGLGTGRLAKSSVGLRRLSTPSRKREYPGFQSCDVALIVGQVDSACPWRSRFEPLDRLEGLHGIRRDRDERQVDAALSEGLMSGIGWKTSLRRARQSAGMARRNSDGWRRSTLRPGCPGRHSTRNSDGRRPGPFARAAKIDFKGRRARSRFGRAKLRRNSESAIGRPPALSPRRRRRNRFSPHRLELETWSQTRFVPAQAYAEPTPAAIEAWERAQEARRREKAIRRCDQFDNRNVCHCKCSGTELAILSD